MPRTLPFLIAAVPLFAQAQSAPAWQACTSVADAAQRLACFDAWARGQQPPAIEAAPAAPAAPPPPLVPTPLAKQPVTPPVPAVVETRRGVRMTATEGCHDARYSEL